MMRLRHPFGMSRIGSVLCLLFSVAFGDFWCTEEAAAQEKRTTYDIEKEVVTRKDRTGGVTAYHLDPLHRIIAIHYSDGPIVRYAYDESGRLHRMTDSLGTTLYQYDIHDRLIQVTDVNNHTLRYRYGAFGLISAVIYPDGTDVSYVYDPQLRLRTVRLPSGPVEYKYDKNGTLSEQTLPNGIRTSYKYDSDGRLTLLSHRHQKGDLLLEFQYRYDLLGRTIGVVRREGSNTTETRYTYDDHSRLLNVEQSGGHRIRYEYEKGNRTVIDDSKNGRTNYRYDEKGRVARMTTTLGETAFRYDQNGNLIERREPTGNVVRYTWNRDHRLKEMVDGIKKVELSYDGAGRLLSKNVNGEVTHFIHDPLGLFPGLAGEVSGVYKPHFYGHEPLGCCSGPEGSFLFLTDGFGTVAALTDAGGAMVERFDYDPFGHPLKGTPPIHSPVGGFLFDPDLGLSEGVYDPKHGMFIREPAKLIGDTYQTIKEIRGFANDTKEILGYSFPVLMNAKTKQYELFPSSQGYTPSDLKYVSRAYPIGEALKKAGNVVKIIDSGMGGFRAGQAINEKKYGSAAFEFSKPFAKYFAGRGVTAGLDFLTRRAALQALGASMSAPALLPIAVNTALIGLSAVTIDLSLDVVQAHIRIGEMDHLTAQLRERGLRNLKARGAGQAEVAEFLRKTGVPEEEIPNVPGAIFQDGTQPGPGPCAFGCGGGAESLPGSQPTFGGISLDRSATVFTDLKEIKGATFDPVTRQLILIGEEKVHLPMNLEDLLVVVRSIYSGEEPSMSIEPCRPGLQDGCMKVLYNGRFQHPDHPEWNWVEYGRDGKLVQVSPPATFGSHAGSVLVKSDLFLKSASGLGDQADFKKVLRPEGRPFKTLLTRQAERSAAQPNYRIATEDDCLIRTEADRKRSSNCFRIWLVPGEIVVRTGADGKSMQFDPVRMKAQARFVRFDSTGRMVDVPGEDPAVAEFVADFTDHYPDFEKRELQELTPLAQIVGLVRWLRDHVEMDLGWVKSGPTSSQETPLTTPGIFAGAGRVRTYGGIDFGKNVYRSNDREATRLAAAAIAARPSSGQLSWSFNHRGRKFRGVALQLGPTPLRGGHTITRRDASLPLGVGIDLGVTVEYNSLNPALGPFGKGWSLVLPSLSFRTIPGDGNKDTYRLKAVLTSGESRTAFMLASDGAFRPTDPTSEFAAIGWTDRDPFEPLVLSGLDIHPSLPGEAVEIADREDRSISYGGFTAVRKDGVRIAFDTRGRPVGVRTDSGKSVTYSYDKDSLTEISSSSGERIQISYNNEGRVSRVAHSGGGVVQYRYNSEGELLRILDGKGGEITAYGYGKDGRVSAVLNSTGQTTRKISYDDLGRIIHFQEDRTQLDLIHDDRRHTMTYRGKNGRTFTRGFDRQNRLISEIGPSGEKSLLSYAADGKLNKISDSNGHDVEFHYDSIGNVEEIVTPVGSRIRFLNHGPHGQPQILIDPSDRITLVKYDSRGRMIELSKGFKLESITKKGEISYRAIDPKTVFFEYNPEGRLTRIHNTDGLSAAFRYDKTGHLLGTIFGGKE